MKEEECKVPIQDDPKNSVEKTKIINYSMNNKVIIITAFLLLIALLSMTAFTLPLLNGISELKQEIEYLKMSIEELQEKIKNNEQDLSKRIANTLNIDSNNTDDVNYDDYDIYENDYYDYEEEPNNYRDSEFSELLTGDQFTKDAKNATPSPRLKRSIIGYTQDGTPINSEGYMETKPRNNTAKKYYSTAQSGSYTNQFYPEETTPYSRQLRSRRIHVYPYDNGQNYHHGYRSRFSEENRDVEFVDEQSGSGHRQRRLELDEQHVKTGRMRPLPAAHFSGDTSKYVIGLHENFEGNGRLRHPRQTFIDWAETKWFSILGMNRHFSLSDGLLTIKEPGLYFIYAQIFYFDEHDINGFRVYRNDNETLLQCTTTTHSVAREPKANTCFTAGAEYLDENDKISVRDLSEARYSLFEPGKSFFGVIKLGDVKIK